MKGLGAAFVFTLCTASLSAQSARISGSVKDAGSGASLAGAVVSVLDADRKTIARAITLTDGSYAVLSSPRAAELRVVRIGFQPRSIAVLMRGDSSAVIDIQMKRLATLLSAVNVREDRLCSDNRDGAAALSLWGQARAGLLASVVARETQPANAVIYGYERVIDLGLNRVVRHVAHSARGRTTRPFAAANDPATLATRGYAETDASGALIFKSPDADVLLDESFARTHCFAVLTDDGSHPGQVGLAFEPARGRDTLVDVRGALWMDTGVPALRSLEFRFTGSNAVLSHERADGNVQFQTMPNGVVFIDEWKVTLPILKRENTRAFVGVGGTSRTVQARNGADTELRLVQLGESGGLVLRATWPDGLTYETALHPFTGTVTERGTTIPLPGTLVFLAGTADTVLTDSAGRFAFYPVLPGRYELHAADTTLFEFVHTREAASTVTIPSGASAPVNVSLMGRLASLKQYCSSGPEQHRAATTTLVGRLVGRDNTATVLENVQVVASWALDTQRVGVDDLGRFSVCGIKRGQRVRLNIEHLGVAYADTTLSRATTEIVTLAWPVDFDALLKTKTGKAKP